MKKKTVMGFKAWILNYEKEERTENGGFVHPLVELLCEKIKRDHEMPEVFASRKALVDYLVSKAAPPNTVLFAKKVFGWYERYCREEAARAPDNPWVD